MQKYITIFSLVVLLSNAVKIVHQGVGEFMPCKVKSISKANREFAFDLFREVAAQHGSENVFISPLVVSMGLSMILDGAGNTTRDQLLQGLKFANPSLKSGVNLGCVYEKYNMLAKPEISTAVKLFADKSMIFHDDFLIETSRYANHKLEQVDFAEHPEKCRIRINEWVEEKTQNKIKGLFPPGSISAQTKLVLASTLYFKAQWENQFDKAKPGEFFVTEERTVPAQMMTKKNIAVRTMYDESTGLDFVELPYQYKKGGLQVSMILILDSYDIGFDVAELRLNYQATEQAITALMKKDPAKTVITLPKFNMTLSYDLSGPLRAMGITDIFSPGSADFSRMTSDSENLYISKALHKTFLVVDESGSEAAAASGFQLTALSLDGYRFDKPFHFLIYEKSTQSILFIGRLANPSAN